jgi:hypothetical protein
VPTYSKIKISNCPSKSIIYTSGSMEWLPMETTARDGEVKGKVIFEL